jgi:hypothetical protein
MLIVLPGQRTKYQPPGVAPPGPKTAAVFAGIGVYVHEVPEFPFTPCPPEPGIPGVDVALVAPTLTVLPLSEAELEFVAAQATKAPCVPRSEAAAMKIFDRRVTPPPQLSTFEQGAGSAIRTNSGLQLGRKPVSLEGIFSRVTLLKVHGARQSSTMASDPPPIHVRVEAAPPLNVRRLRGVRMPRNLAAHTKELALVAEKSR